MYTFELVIRANSSAFLNRFVFRLRSFSRRSRSLFTMAMFAEKYCISRREVDKLM